MSQELRLRYLVQLASNIGVVARQDAQQFEEANRRMQTATQRTGRDAGTLERTLRQLGAHTGLERQVGYLDRMAASIDKVTAKAKAMHTQMAQAMKDNGIGPMEIAATGAAGYYGGKAMLLPPIKAYADLEEATVGLKAAMLDNTGKIDKSFGAIAKKAEELGNQLPGTTKDFFSSATQLIRQGIDPGKVAGGALEASAKFGVVMKMDQGQAARTIAKVREAYQLKEGELPQMADLMQRASFSAGIDPQDFLDVARYAAPTYNTMKLTGLGHAKQLLAIQGMAAGVGLESTSFGTNFAQMLSRLSQVDSRVAKNSPDARAVKELLDSKGLALSFYGKDGEFSGIENMLKELAKLRSLSSVDKQHVAKLMFGDEAGRPAQILIDKGMESYQDMLSKMDSQASLNQRLDMVVSSFAAKLEALGGTIENVMAKIATQTGEGLKPVMDGTNSFLGGVGDFVGANPAAGTAGLAGLTLLGAAAGMRGSSALFGAIKGLRGGAAAAPAAAAAVASNPFRGLGVSIPPPAVAPTLLSRLRGGAKWLGPAAAVAGFGLESYDAITDEQLTAMGKARGVGIAAAGAGGAWGGAAAGAALGTMVMPGVGTVAGGLLGGALGYWGGEKLMGSIWGQDPKRDFVRATDPNGNVLGQAAQGGVATVELGQGQLQINVQVSSDGTPSVSTSVTREIPLIKIDAGSTNPGSFSAASGGGKR
jgi:TP901 family phage tail tape measure protein